MARRIRWAWLVWAVLPLALGGCFGAVTGDVEQVLTRTDRSDPLRAAVADALAAVDQRFEPVLGQPLPASEKERLVDEWSSFQWSTQGQSSMDLLRMAESMASSSRSVRHSIPGAEAVFYEQPIVRGNVNAVTRMIEFRFPCVFEERERVASELLRRVEPMFANAPKWHRTDVYDRSMNPVTGSTTFLTYLAMGVDASSEITYVSVDYYHERNNHEVMRGVRVAVVLQSTRLE